jgi:hypothetical protein
MEKIDDLLKKHRIQSCHTNFQIENFIIGKETSEYGKMWQCLRELQHRKESLEALDLDIEDADDNINLIGLKISKLQEVMTFKQNKLLQTYAEEKKNIVLRKLNRKLLRMQKAKASLDVKKTEILQEVEVFLNLFEQVVEKTEYKDFNNPEAQLHYWSAKLDTELNLNALLNQPVSTELIRTCLALPDGSSVKQQITVALSKLNKKLIEKTN